MSAPNPAKNLVLYADNKRMLMTVISPFSYVTGVSAR